VSITKTVYSRAEIAWRKPAFVCHFNYGSHELLYQDAYNSMGNDDYMSSDFRGYSQFGYYYDYTSDGARMSPLNKKFGRYGYRSRKLDVLEFDLENGASTGRLDGLFERDFDIHFWINLPQYPFMNQPPYGQLYYRLKSLLRLESAEDSMSFAEIMGKIVTNHGNVIASRSDRIHGRSTSALFPGGASDYLTIENAYVTVPGYPSNYSGYGFNLGTYRWSIEFWIKFNSAPTDPGMFICGQIKDSGNFYFIKVDSSKIHFMARNGDIEVIYFTKNFIPVVGQDYHIQVANVGSGTIAFWINGTYDAGTSVSLIAYSRVGFDSGDFYVGGDNGLLTNLTTKVHPYMTAASVPSPYVITPSSETSWGINYKGWRAFDSTEYGWFSNSNTGSIKIDMGSQTYVKYYSMGKMEYTTSGPKTWVLEGSNDNSSWDLLDTQTNVPIWVSSESRRYTISLSCYRWYRITVSLNHGGGNLFIGDIRFLNDAPPLELCPFDGLLNDLRVIWNEYRYYNTNKPPLFGFFNSCYDGDFRHVLNIGYDSAFPFKVMLQERKITVAASTTGMSYDIILRSVNDYVDDDWFHVALIQRGTRFSLCINGQEEDYVILPDNIIISDDYYQNELLVSYGLDDFSESVQSGFDGWMDELIIF